MGARVNYAPFVRKSGPLAAKIGYLRAAREAAGLIAPESKELRPIIVPFGEPDKLEAIAKAKAKAERLANRSGPKRRHVKNQRICVADDCCVVSLSHPIETIKATVAAAYGVTVEGIEGPCAQMEFAEPRMISVYLARVMLRRSSTRISPHFGTRGPSTILFAQRKIALRIEADDRIARNVEILRAVLAPVVGGQK